MSRSTRTAMRSLRATSAALLLTLGLAACTSTADDQVVEQPDAAEAAEDTDADDTDEAGDEAAAAFPVTVTHDGGETTLDTAPTAIVSLSPTSTEMLFAIGAGDLVVAADDFSNFPEEAPTTELSGFDPNVEAILTYEPDLVIASGDSNDLVAGLAAVDVPVLLFGSAVTLDDTYAQLRQLGAATGTSEQAEAVATQIQTDLQALVDGAAGEGLTYYHELSADLFSVTSSTFIGEIYSLFGLENIADPADEDGFGYPQLSAEFIVDADPDLVFLACTKFCSETADTFAAREGYDQLSAVQNGYIVELDDDIASRWGPRVVDFAESIAKALTEVS